MRGLLLEKSKDIIRKIVPNKVLQKTISPVRRLYLDRAYARKEYQFIHINKCGGTSVERALGLPFLNHDNAVERRIRVGELHWNRCYTFTVCRNPYDRMESVFYYQNRGRTINEGNLSSEFERMLENMLGNKPNFGKPRMYESQAAWISDKETGLVLIDAAFKLEKLESSWGELKRNIPSIRLLEQLKVRKRANCGMELYTASTVEMVSQYCSLDFDLFNYSTDKSSADRSGDDVIQFSDRLQAP